MIEPTTVESIKSAGETALSWDFFANLPEEKEAFMRLARQKKVSRKEVVFSEGDAAASVFYISEGRIIVSRTSSSGKEVVLYIHRKGALMGALAALLDQPRNSKEQAITPGILYEISSRDFRSLVERFPRLNQRLQLQLYGSQDYMTSQYLSAFSDSAEIRLKKLLARLFSEELLKLTPDGRPDSISLYVTQDQLACAIGISREMVSRLLKRLQTEGLLTKTAHKISFLKPEQFLSYLEIIPTYRR